VLHLSLEITIDYYGDKHEISPSSTLFSRNYFTTLKNDTIRSGKAVIYNMVVATPPGFRIQFLLHHLNSDHTIKKV